MNEENLKRLLNLVDVNNKYKLVSVENHKDHSVNVKIGYIKQEEGYIAAFRSRKEITDNEIITILRCIT